MAGRPAPLPPWTEVFASGVMGWICGIQGMLFQRQADYMMAYLVTARSHPALWYFGWALCCVVFSMAGSRMVQGVRRGFPVARGRVALLSGLLVAGCGALLWPRLFVIGSTLEFTVGIARAFSTMPAARMLLVLTSFGAFIPAFGAIVFVAIDAFRQRRKAA